MLRKPECDVYDLLDEAYALSLAVRIETGRARKLVEQLRMCAEQAGEEGLGEMRKQLLGAAEALEKQMGEQPGSSSS